MAPPLRLATPATHRRHHTAPPRATHRHRLPTGPAAAARPRLAPGAPTPLPLSRLASTASTPKSPIAQALRRPAAPGCPVARPAAGVKTLCPRAPATHPHRQPAAAPRAAPPAEPRPTATPCPSPLGRQSRAAGKAAAPLPATRGPTPPGPRHPAIAAAPPPPTRGPIHLRPHQPAIAAGPPPPRRTPPTRPMLPPSFVLQAVRATATITATATVTGTGRPPRRRHGCGSC